MSRWTSNTTPEQKAACIEALCDREISAPRVSIMAAKGELGLPPFDISPSSCRRLRTAENEKRDQARRMSPENRQERIENLRSRALALLHDCMTLLETGQKATIPLSQVKGILAAANELETGWQTRRAAKLMKDQPGQEPQDHSNSTGTGLVARLRGAAQNGADDDGGKTAASPARAPLTVVQPDDAA